MRKKRKQRTESKYEAEAVIIKNTVSKIEYQNLPVGDRYKTIFYVPSYLCPEGRMCVFWQRNNINVGDEIAMKGRFSDGVFLVWSLQVYKRAEQNGS